MTVQEWHRQLERIQAIKKKHTPVRALSLYLLTVTLIACSGGGSGGGAPAAVAPKDDGGTDTLIVINEVSVNSSDGPDWIELHNAGDVDVGLSGWAIAELVTGHFMKIGDRLGATAPCGSAFAELWARSR